MYLQGAFLLLPNGFFLWFDNPTVNIGASDIGESRPAGKVDCSIAGWDAGLNHNRDGPGGEHSGTYFNEVAAECYSANKTRFDAGFAIGILALLTLAAGVMIAARSSGE